MFNVNSTSFKEYRIGRTMWADNVDQRRASTTAGRGTDHSACRPQDENLTTCPNFQLDGGQAPQITPSSSRYSAEGNVLSISFRYACFVSSSMKYFDQTVYE